jgi:trans-feruloyl-CoA hydratase/vanillin synthase
MDYETIMVETKDLVTTITFNRPERRNAMNPRMHLEMVDVLSALEYDDDCRVLVLTGAGESFCAGQDLKEYFYDLDDNPTARAKARKAAEEWRSHRLRLFPKPTIAAINGYCFGGAFTIVASCDFAIAADSATFGLSEVNFGKLPGGHVTKIVQELFHPRDALYYIMTGKPFDAQKAAEIRFVTMAVPRDRLWDEVNELADCLKAKNPAVLRAAKEAYKYIRDMNWEEAGAWLSAKSKELDLVAGKTWKTGVEQFKAHEYRPGLGHYDWKKDQERDDS